MNGHDVIFFSGLPWNFIKQRHHHVASRLAEKNRVLFVEPQLSIISEWRYPDRLPRLRKVGSNLVLMRPFPGLPFKKKLSYLYYVNSWLAIKSIRETAKALNFERPILWATVPEAELMVGKLEKTIVIYDCLDDYKSFPGLPSHFIARLDQRLTESADVVFATAEGLFVQKSTLNPNCHLVPNGVDYNLFGSQGETSEILKGIPRPIIGYVGMISDWLDFDLLSTVADACPNFSFVLVGPTRTSFHLPAPKNIHFLGQHPYERIPGIIRGFDVGIIPFNLNELTANTNPVKVYEYLSAGIPVVSTRLPELKTMEAKNYVSIGDTPSEWIKLLEKAISEKDPEIVASRKHFARNNSWLQRIQKMEYEIDKLIGK